jgi:hypothetical protein
LFFGAILFGAFASAIFPNIDFDTGVEIAITIIIAIFLIGINL